MRLPSAQPTSMPSTQPNPHRDAILLLTPPQIMTLVAEEASKQVAEGGTDVAAEQTDLQVRPDCACALLEFRADVSGRALAFKFLLFSESRLPLR